MLINRWMKGALNAPTESGRIRIAWAKRKGSIKRQGFKRYSRHEGLAPVRLSIGLETGSGSFAGEFLPDIGSIGLSLSKRSRTPGVPFPFAP